MNRDLSIQIMASLRRISAHDLQVVAEEMACVKFPKRFRVGALVSRGRNGEAQTTKNWPDAYVSTAEGVVDGIEATRQSSWSTHLDEDLGKARSAENDNLSGYFFIGGQPDQSPSAKELTSYTDSFAALGIPRDRVTILVGRDLVRELEAPEYARIRQRRLGIAQELAWFRLLQVGRAAENRPELFHPTDEDFENGRVAGPALVGDVLRALDESGVALVRGYGAAGKTTLSELVCRDPAFARNSAWYLDLAAGVEEPGPTVLNEMIELSGPGVIFVIDNIHVQEGCAKWLLAQWSEHCRPLGARLLLLGRWTSSADEGRLADLSPLILRAGYDEMIAVVARLYARRGERPPALARPIIAEWAITFGGEADPKTTKVDLIAFTAAVDRRLEDFLRGDFRLSEADAIAGVRVRYLQPLQMQSELGNLMRLAALAEFEIEASDGVLPSPLAGFRTSIRDLGVVVSHRVGAERRQVYSLVHPHLGRLFAQAAGSEFDIFAEQLAAAVQNPAIGLRIRAKLRGRTGSDERRDAFDKAVTNALTTDDPAAKALSLYELSAVANHLRWLDLLSADELDETIAGSPAYRRLLRGTRSLIAVNAFVSWARRLGLRRCLEVLNQEAIVAGSEINRSIYVSRASDVAAVARALPNGGALIQGLDEKWWSLSQAAMPPELATDTVSAGRFFEEQRCSMLAMAPASRQVRAGNPQRWSAADLGDLAHILRFANCSVDEKRGLLEALVATGWLTRAVNFGLIGPLCGALISMSNHLEIELRSLVLTPELRARVFNELGRPFSGKAKHAARSICLLGGFTALGGQMENLRRPAFEVPYTVDDLLNDLRQKRSTDDLGMYELQFWLGLKALYEVGLGPEMISSESGDRFVRQLMSAQPPTEWARRHQSNLLQWLRVREADGWRLGGNKQIVT